MRISDWSSDVCSSDLGLVGVVRRQRPCQRGIDLRHEVEPDEIEQAEHTSLRNAERSPHDGVGLLLREAALDRFPHRALQPEGADAVGDEARRVVAMNDALANDAVAENGHPQNGTASWRARGGKDVWLSV